MSVFLWNIFFLTKIKLSKPANESSSSKIDMVKLEREREIYFGVNFYAFILESKPKMYKEVIFQ